MSLPTLPQLTGDAVRDIQALYEYLQAFQLTFDISVTQVLDTAAPTTIQISNHSAMLIDADIIAEEPFIIPGPQGPQGLQGLPGPPGLDADEPEIVIPLPGNQGAQGVQGLQGPPGLDGLDGEEILMIISAATTIV